MRDFHGLVEQVHPGCALNTHMATMVDIVIVNWNSGTLLCQCLTSISGALDNSQISVRVVVVDNASRDGSCDNLPAPGYPLVVIRNSHNAGFAAACNQGARQTTGEYVLFLNPDTRLLPGALIVPLQFMQQAEHARVGICGVQLLDSQGQVARSCARFPSLRNILAKMLGLACFFPRSGMTMREWDHLEGRQVDQVMGAYFLVRRSVFDSLNGFDERFLVYFEDVDFALRARQAGWSSRYLANISIYHEGGGTTRNIKGIRLFYFLRSRILYAGKHFSMSDAVAHMALTLSIEPLARLVFSLGRGKMADAGNVAHATFLLWRDLPGMVAALRRGVR